MGPPPPPHGGAPASQPLQGIPISRPIGDAVAAAPGYDDRYSACLRNHAPQEFQQLGGKLHI
jgi:hypothetical protein